MVYNVIYWRWHMTSMRRALLFGFLIWLIPFMIAFLIFPLRESARPLFESIMPVAVAAATSVFAVVYFQNAVGNPIREGLLLGLIWWLVSLLIDAPLMLLGGPMQMSLGEYFADIGLTYMMMPVITTGIGAALAYRSRSAGSDDTLP
jgi:uncharacterized membrane protein YagU involved in acid resistance